MTITEFLLAQIAKDAAEARSVLEDRRYFQQVSWGWYDADLGDFHPAEYGKSGTGLPTRVLAECEAKRRIVERHTEFHVTTRNDGLDWDYRGCIACSDPEGWEPSDGDWFPCATLRDVASVYADQPDFDPAWRAE